MSFVMSTEAPPLRLGTFGCLQKAQVPLILELCAGHAVLSSVSETLGFQALAVDNSSSRAPGKRLLRLDLADADNIDYLLELIESERSRILP